MNVDLDDLKKKLSFKKSLITVLIVLFIKLFLDYSNGSLRPLNALANATSLLGSFTLSYYFISGKSFDDMEVPRFASLVLPISLVVMLIINLIVK